LNNHPIYIQPKPFVPSSGASRVSKIGKDDRVAVDGDAVGAGGDHLGQGARHRHHILPGQAVDQVDGNRAEPGRARRLDDGQRARIDLDGVCACLVGRQLEALADVSHQVIHLRIRQIGRRAAADMQLFDLVHAGKQRRLHVDLAFEIAQIERRLGAVPGDDLVAGAVVADGVAKRNMQVQRQGPAGARTTAISHRAPVIARREIGREIGREAVGRGIGGVTRPALLHLAQDLPAHAGKRGGRGKGRGWADWHGMLRNTARHAVASRGAWHRADRMG